MVWDCHAFIISSFHMMLSSIHYLPVLSLWLNQNSNFFWVGGIAGQWDNECTWTVVSATVLFFFKIERSMIKGSVHQLCPCDVLLCTSVGKQWRKLEEVHIATVGFAGCLTVACKHPLLLPFRAIPTAGVASGERPLAHHGEASYKT